MKAIALLVPESDRFSFIQPILPESDRFFVERWAIIAFGNIASNRSGVNCDHVLVSIIT
jgi:hypothetical protein